MDNAEHGRLPLTLEAATKRAASAGACEAFR